MHIGNLRTALYEYLIAKHYGGRFILRIEDTDQNRWVDGSVEAIHNTLITAGLRYDEGPDIGGEYGPYVQSRRKDIYLKYAQELVANGKAYYCFCGKECLDALTEHEKYDRRCLNLTAEEIQAKLASGAPYVIRQLIPDGETRFLDLVFGDITINNDELDDQVLIKSDGLPTYNFANVIDDHLMEITHVIRGNEYLSSTPKYNLLYDAFRWKIPVYIHLPLILNANGEKMSKRKGDASFEDLLAQGFLPEAVVNYIALLGWSPADNNEIFSLPELIEQFDETRLSKAPSAFDTRKLTWINGEYIKKLAPEAFQAMSLPVLKSAVKTPGIDLVSVSEMVQTRINFIYEIPQLVDFIDKLPDYGAELYTHKKMKTNTENSLANLKHALTVLYGLNLWDLTHIHDALAGLVESLGIKNGQMLWPVRTALSGKPSSPCGAAELCALLGKDESLKRIQMGIALLESYLM
jgi:glutamyl-tRNA synthetase